MERRDELLARTFEYVAQHGLHEFSLRALARELDTNARMLVYYFGSKEELVAALFTHAESIQRESLRAWRAGQGDAKLSDRLRSFWRWLASDEVRPLMKLTFDIYALALRPDAEMQEFVVRLTEEWLAAIEATLGANDSPASASLTLAMLRGLVLDLMLTGQVERVEAAFEAYLTLLVPPA